MNFTKIALKYILILKLIISNINKFYKLNKILLRFEKLAKPKSYNLKIENLANLLN